MIENQLPVQGYYGDMHIRKGHPGILQTLAAVGVACFLLAWSSSAHAAKVSFRFSAWDGPALRVFATRPVHLAPDRPVVFVMHGVKRNADEYRDQWHDLAIENDFLLVVPEFSERDFPGPERYNLGNVIGENGSVIPEPEWTYSVIDAIFDDVRSRFGVTTDRYALYGHSAGAQFVQRFIFHVPGARLSRIVAANAGWYLMPDFDVAFPYGLGGSVVDRDRLVRGLQLPVTILLGTADTETDQPNLRRTPEAMLQGPHRLARGQTFYAAAKTAALELGVPFSWRLELVDGAEHDNRVMAAAAIPFLLDP